MERGMEEQILSAVLLLEVRARQSGRFVELLRKEYPELQEAAAVYSEFDVIGIASASRQRLGELVLELMQRQIKDHEPAALVQTTYRFESVRFLVVNGELRRGKEDNPVFLDGGLVAYVLIETDNDQATPSQVAREILKCEGIVFCANLMDDSVIVKMRASNKGAFDNKIMDQIQSIPGVATTRSFIIIK
jgi:DNA-binding Lrp family transcriptional regulator